MPGGRPPKPTKLKLVQGTDRPDRANPREPVPPGGDVKAPSWLHGRGRAAWKAIAPLLSEMGVLTTADPQALALLCDAYGEYIDCREVVRKRGAVYESRVLKVGNRGVDTDVEEEMEGQAHGGALKRRRALDDDVEDWSVIMRPRPEVKMASDAWRRVQRMLVEFGMTPSSRAKVSGSRGEEGDPFEDFLTFGRTAG